MRGCHHLQCVGRVARKVVTLNSARHVIKKESLARPERFELPTSWFVAMRSIQLSYGRVQRGTYIYVGPRADGDELPWIQGVT